MAVVMGGGYASHMTDTVDIHFNTVRSWQSPPQARRPGDGRRTILAEDDSFPVA